MTERKKRVFLAGRIDGLPDEDACAWRLWAADLLRMADFQPVDPTRCFGQHRFREDELFHEIVSQNHCDILTCDYMIAKCDEPSWGTPMDIKEAWDRGVKIVLFRTSVHKYYKAKEDARNRPTSSTDTRVPEVDWSPYLRFHSHARVESLSEAVAWCVRHRQELSEKS